MYKFIQVHEGRNNLEFRVKAGKTLNLLLYGSVSFNARLTVKLMGIGSSAMITGILIGKDDTKQILHTMQIHKAPGTTSDLLVKTVLRDHAVCLYDGGIRIEKSAQKTDAYQRNENLLLSDHAYAQSKPSLEILADDVRCTHGATVGPINKEQLWYLTSRGISPHNAEALIVRGFIQSALARVVERRAKRGIISLWHSMSKQ
jgi:Fe-S cluster assembly protein SufD